MLDKGKPRKQLICELCHCIAGRPPAGDIDLYYKTFNRVKNMGREQLVKELYHAEMDATEVRYEVAVAKTVRPSLESLTAPADTQRASVDGQ